MSKGWVTKCWRLRQYSGEMLLHASLIHILLPDIWFQPASEIGCWARQTYNLSVLFNVLMKRHMRLLQRLWILRKYSILWINSTRAEQVVVHLRARWFSLYQTSSVHLSAVSKFFWDQSRRSEQLVKTEPGRFWNGADGKSACDELALATTTHQSQTPASEWEKNIQPWNLLRFAVPLGTQITRWHVSHALMHIPSHRLWWHTLVPQGCLLLALC